MSIRQIPVLLEDNIGSIEKIESYCGDLNYIEFVKDSKTQDAFIRNIEIIGEAVKRLTEDFKEKHSEIPWNNIKGTRNRLIHDYSGVNLDILWNIIKEDLPDLLLKISRIKAE